MPPIGRTDLPDCVRPRRASLDAVVQVAGPSWWRVGRERAHDLFGQEARPEVARGDGEAPVRCEDEFLHPLGVRRTRYSQTCVPSSAPQFIEPAGSGTILLPGRLSSAAANACEGRPDTPWRDVRAGAPVSIRNGAGKVLATWTLPTGAILSAARGSGCRFVLTQSSGIEMSFDTYALRLASHTLTVPRDNIGGNLFIELPNRQYTRSIRVSGSD